MRQNRSKGFAIDWPNLGKKTSAGPTILLGAGWGTLTAATSLTAGGVAARAVDNPVLSKAIKKIINPTILTKNFWRLMFTGLLLVKMFDKIGQAKTLASCLYLVEYVSIFRMVKSW
jgi:prolipoprotein diacylglyceryltransferase